MEYIFMHQNIPVAELEMDEATGLIQKVNQVFAPEHLPTGVSVKIININAQSSTQDDVEKNVAEDYTRKNKEV